MRKIAAGLVLLLAGGAGAEEESRLVARLSAGSPGYTMRRGYALPEGVAAVERPKARKARIDGDVYFFFDVDGNGEYDDLGIDGWALAKMPYLLPLEEETVIGASVWSWQVDAEGKELLYRVTRLPLSEGQRQLLIHFNQWRFMNGLPAVTIDQELCDACEKHCAYMERHGLTHVETEGAEGYTPEGAEAGRRSCLSEEGPLQSVAMFYATFYHRLPLIHPGTKRIGVGASERYTAIDGISARAERAWEWPVIVPAPNSFGHPTHFAPEAPNPLPDDVKWGGFPITLTFREGRITDVEAELRSKSSRGRPVPIAVSSPERPAHPDRPDNRNTICIVPKLPLGPRHTWWVKVTYELDGAPRAHEWRFNTGGWGPAPVVTAQRASR